MDALLKDLVTQRITSVGESVPEGRSGPVWGCGWIRYDLYVLTVLHNVPYLDVIRRSVLMNVGICDGAKGH